MTPAAPPQAKALKGLLWRWREALAGAALLLIGLWISLAAFGVTKALGYAIAAASVVLILAGVQQARFRLGAGGPGIVLIREALVTYFGPNSGGAINIGSLARLELDGRAQPVPEWRLTEPGQPTLTVPVTAENAESLFDVFATLPGIETERMLTALRHPPEDLVLIWGTPYERPRLRRVH